MKFLSIVFVVLLSQNILAATSSSSEKINADGTSKASVKEVVPSPWSFSFDSEFGLNQEESSLKGANAKISSTHVIGSKYKYDSKTTFKFVPTIELNYVPLAEERAIDTKDEIKNKKSFGGARFKDPFFGFAKKNGTLLGSDTVTTEFRYYVPVSELSRELQKVGTLRMDVLVPWTVGNWNFTYLLNPHYILESNGIAGRKTAFSFRQYAIGTYSFSDEFSAYTMVGHQMLSKASNFLTNLDTTNVLEIGATKNFTKNFAFSLYVDNVFASGEEVRLFAADKNDFALSTSLTF